MIGVHRSTTRVETRNATIKGIGNNKLEEQKLQAECTTDLIILNKELLSAIIEIVIGFLTSSLMKIKITDDHYLKVDFTFV